MLIDFLVIDQDADKQLEILADRHEIVFRDSSATQLHRVCHAGTLDTFLRAVHAEGFTWIVFDVRRLAPELEADILGHHAVDGNGLVYYTLRLAFESACACEVAAAAAATASWWQSPQLELALEFAA